MMSCQNVAESRRPDSTPGVVPKPWEQVLQASSGAMPRGDSARVGAAVAGYRLRADTIASHHGKMPPGVRAFERKLTAMDARIRGRNEEAVAALTEAVSLEEELSPVGPPGDPTARELLGDLLLELGRVTEAVAATTRRCSGRRSGHRCSSGEPARPQGWTITRAPHIGTVCWRGTGKPPTRTSRNWPRSGRERSPFGRRADHQSGGGLSRASSSASQSASQLASMMFSEQPTVLHRSAPRADSMITRGRAAVPRCSSTMRTL